MKKMIRWQGLGVFFFFIVLIFSFTILFADGVIESVIEQKGSMLVGARVDLEKADLSFFPLGLELSGLEVTNPDEPMRNSVEVGKITFSINSTKLLLRKIIIDEMVMEGIRPDTLRKESGAIEKSAEREKKSVAPVKEAKGFTMPDLKIPDPKEVLAKEKLETIELANEYQEQIRADTVKWQRQLDELPNEETMNQYIERLNRVKSSSGLAGILGGVSELGSIKEEIQGDLERLQSAQKDFSSISDSYRKNLARLQNAPQQDIKRLKDKYSPSARGLANLSPLLFGDKTANIVEQALSWYTKAQPFLERNKEKSGGGEIVKKTRGRGVLVRYTEHEPLPDFLIRNITATVEIQAGIFGGTIMNVTPDQDILGVPLSFSFAGESLRGLSGVQIDGVLDHINPDQSKDNITVEISGFSLAKKDSSSKEKQTIIINKGVLDLSAQADFQEQNVNADIRAELKSASFTTSTEKEGDAVSGALADSLSGISELTAKATVTGTIEDYRIKLSSNLDKILQKAVADTIKTKAAAFEKKLTDEVMKKAQGPLSEAGTSFSDFGGISNELSSRLQQLGNLI